MNNASHYQLSQICERILPSGVTFYGMLRATKDSYEVRFVDHELIVTYFKKDYDIEKGTDIIFAEVIADARDFAERWNSPLMKALR